MLPVFLAVVYALLEFSHVQAVKHILNNACREAARLGSTTGVGEAEVRGRFEEIVETLINPDEATLLLKQLESYDQGNPLPQSMEDWEALPNMNFADPEPRQLFVVQAYVPYQNVAILPLRMWNFMHGDVAADPFTLRAQAFMRHE